MQLGLSRPARPPHLFHALQDYPPITVHVSSAELYHRTVYPMGMVANRSGMRLALAPQPAELKACSSASHPIKSALAYLQEVQTLPTTQPSTAESESFTEASEAQSFSSSEEPVQVLHSGRELLPWQTRLARWRVKVRSVT